MRVLWFEVTVPSVYKSDGAPIGGWQDSLERVVRSIPDIELTIAFVSEERSKVKIINGVSYVPIVVRWNIFEKIWNPYGDFFVKKVLPAAIQIVESYKPDIIHVFGTEWPFGQIANYTETPVVIHIMGAMVPYNNANYPPGLSFRDVIRYNWCNLKLVLLTYILERNNRNSEKWERETWKKVCNYMGRTKWDEALSRVLHPGRRYFHVEEALRYQFINGEKTWRMPDDDIIHIISTGCSGFRKGADMMLKVAHILTLMNIKFEWRVAGYMSKYVKQTIEKQVGVKFEDCNLKVLGYVGADDLLTLLCSSSMYVHTAYIENSPNSICEAQCLGVPVISTNVGGISTLIRNNIDGILIPANDPWQMVDAIIQLASDKNKMMMMSKSSSTFARKRHDDKNIKSQLLNCYKTIVRGDKET